MSEEQATQPQETAKAYAAFLEYCALGRGRSLLKLAERFGEDSGKIRALERTYEKWSSVHHWQERVKQYDREQVEARVAKKQAAKDEMDQRHAEQAKEEQEVARAHIMASIAKRSNNPDEKQEGRVIVSGKISLAAVQLLKNSREDERKALTEEEMPMSEQDGPFVGIMVYLPQKRSLKEAPGGSSKS